MTNHRKKALGLSIIPGLGQFYNGQWQKGLIFLVFGLSFIFSFSTMIRDGLWGLITLGEIPGQDNSIFLMAEGIITVIIIVFGLAVWLFSAKDAYHVGRCRDEDSKIHTLREQYLNLIDQGYPYLISGPAFFLLVFSVIYPLLFSFAIAFTNYNLHTAPPRNLFTWVGFDTFRAIFTVDIWRSTFVDVLSWTVIWTLIASTLQVAIGIFLAVVVNQKDLKFKRLIRTVLVLPWAVPGFVTILIFSGMFNDSFGAINTVVLDFFNISPISWMTNATWTRVAIIMIQGWLGFPYIFLVTTGVLQAIPGDLYEAADIDGATIIQKFWKITLPLLLIAISPIIITQYTFNFNNFNIIYLFNAGGPAVPGSTAGGTDILVSWIYSLTLSSSQFALAAALTILLSIFVVTIALWQFRRTAAFNDGERKTKKRKVKTA